MQWDCHHDQNKHLDNHHHTLDDDPRGFGRRLEWIRKAFTQHRYLQRRKKYNHMYGVRFMVVSTDLVDGIINMRRTCTRGSFLGVMSDMILLLPLHCLPQQMSTTNQTKRQQLNASGAWNCTITNSSWNKMRSFVQFGYRYYWFCGKWQLTLQMVNFGCMPRNYPVPYAGNDVLKC